MVAIGTITYKNQLTIPQELLQGLEWIKPRKVLIESRDEGLLIKPVLSTVSALSGSLHHLVKKNPIPPAKMREIVQKKVAQEIAREGL